MNDLSGEVKLKEAIKNWNSHSGADTAESDDFGFQTIGSGLGFHQEETKLKIQNNGVAKKPAVAARSQVFKSPNWREQQAALDKELEIKLKERVLQTEPPKQKALPQKANQNYLQTIPLQFIAWVVDVALIAAMVAISAGLFVLVSQMEPSILMQILTPIDLIIFGGSLFSLYYLVYFTILDLGTSPGKRLLGLKLKNWKDEVPRPRETFLRAIITYTSLIVGGLPLLIDFQGKLSETKVSK